MHTTPSSLLERLQKGTEPEAWVGFVELYSPLIHGWARRAGVSREDAVDLVQDVLTLLVQKMPDFVYDRNKSFRSWLRTVTLNKWREKRRRPMVAAVQPASGQLDELPNPESDRAFEEHDYRRYLVRRALELMQARFQPTTWKACWEHVVAGRSAADVAAELGMSEGAVYVAKHRVVRQLRSELAGLLD